MSGPTRVGDALAAEWAARRYGVSRVVDVSMDPWGNLTRAPRQEHEVELMLPMEDQVGETRRYEIVLPFLPPTKNEADAWAPEWRTAAKQKWRKHIKDACERRAMPTNVPRIGLAAMLVFPQNRVRDPQNYAPFLWNWVCDALQGGVHQGYPLIPDDRDGRIDFGKKSSLGITFAVDTHKDWPVKKRKRTRLAITLQVP